MKIVGIARVPEIATAVAAVAMTTTSVHRYTRDCACRITTRNVLAVRWGSVRTATATAVL